MLLLQRLLPLLWERPVSVRRGPRRTVYRLYLDRFRVFLRENFTCVCVLVCSLHSASHPQAALPDPIEQFQELPGQEIPDAEALDDAMDPEP